MFLIGLYQVVVGPCHMWMGSRHLVLKHAFSELDCCFGNICLFIHPFITSSVLDEHKIL